MSPVIRFKELCYNINQEEQLHWITHSFKETAIKEQEAHLKQVEAAQMLKRTIIIKLTNEKFYIIL